MVRLVPAGEKLNWWQRFVKSLTINRSDVPDVWYGWPGASYLGAYGELYRKQPAVRTVVDWQAKQIAQLNPKLYMRVSDTDRQEESDHPLAVILRQPNPRTTRFRHMRDTVADIGIYDRAYWSKLRTRGLVTGLLRVPPGRVQVEFDRTELRNRYLVDGKLVDRDDLVIFPGYHPEGSEQGVSPLETLRQVLAEEWAARTHAEWFWRNSARREGVISRPVDAPKWSPTARTRFRDSWEQTMTGGRNAGRTGILEEGMTWKDTSFSPKEAMYIDGRRLTYEEVWRVYAPSLAGMLDAGPAANIEAFHRQTYQDVLAPLCQFIEDEIGLQLLTLPEFDFGPAYVEFGLRDKLKGSFVDETQALTTAVGVPHLTINEARARQNLPRINEPWADIPVQPLNVMYGGQPATTMPVGGGEEPTQVSAASLATKVAGFFARQERALIPRLGAVNGHPDESVWQTERWTRELAELLAEQMPTLDAAKAAAVVMATQRMRLAQAFSEAGLDGVRQVCAVSADMAAGQLAITKGS
jgi:HK97 family phage portal protein